jgi:hypothetical protein
MASGKEKRIDELQPPKPEIVDRGIVRLGCGFITGQFPPLRMPKLEIADKGVVRLGCGFITGRFPGYR